MEYLRRDKEGSVLNVGLVFRFFLDWGLAEVSLRFTLEFASEPDFRKLKLVFLGMLSNYDDCNDNRIILK